MHMLFILVTLFISLIENRLDYKTAFPVKISEKSQT